MNTARQWLQAGPRSAHMQVPRSFQLPSRARPSRMAPQSSWCMPMLPHSLQPLSRSPNPNLSLSSSSNRSLCP